MTGTKRSITLALACAALALGARPARALAQLTTSDEATAWAAQRVPPRAACPFPAGGQATTSTDEARAQGGLRAASAGPLAPALGVADTGTTDAARSVAGEREDAQALPCSPPPSGRQALR